jgi:hypothetical protein
MGLILSEPIKKVVEVLKKLTKMSVEDAKNHPKRPCKEQRAPQPQFIASDWENRSKKCDGRSLGHQGNDAGDGSGNAASSISDYWISALGHAIRY